MMDSKGMGKQVITFQKTLFENSFNAMKTVQDQAETMMDTIMGQLPWVPEEGKQSINTSIEFYKEARDNFKKAVDDGFVKMEEMFA